ncbi:hypothetical protein GCK32_008080 [Trichostrongylus colubriformis]|uniref:Uncharacterized protein n=1 Tax=Trichostrongylus colubriformis TaxID=6319 RepID=A0AAN8IT36_TRICO
MSTEAQSVALQLNLNVNLVHETLSMFTIMCDLLGESLTKPESQVGSYVTKARTVLELAQTAAVQLHRSARGHATTSEVGTSQKMLPPIPVPSLKCMGISKYSDALRSKRPQSAADQAAKIQLLLNALQGKHEKPVYRNGGEL